jgi:hypothetical protein
MSPSAFALLGFAAWSLVLVGVLAVYRSALVKAGKKASNGFDPSGEDLEGFGRRVTRAHANCYENLPVAGVVLLYAIATSRTAVTDPLAYVFIALRVAQSLVHLVSTSRPAVLLRFTFFVAQIAILTYWLLRFFQIF